MAENEVLKISTERKPRRRVVVTDGQEEKSYELRSTSELRLAEQVALKRYIAVLQRFDAPEATPQEIESLADILDKAIGVVLVEAFPALVQSLNDDQKLAILKAFLDERKEPTQVATPAGVS